MTIEKTRIEDPHETPKTGRGTTTIRERALGAAERYALVLVLVALFVFFALWPKVSGAFLSVANFRNLASGNAVIALLALATLVPLVCNQFDVAVGSVLSVASVSVAAMTTRHGLPVLLAVVLAVAMGALIGAVNGFVVAYLRASSLVITLGMSTLLGGLISLYTKDESIVGIPHVLISFGSENWLGVPWPVWLLLIVILVVSVFLRSTVAGRRLHLIGANSRSAELVGVSTRRMVLVAFMISGTIAGVAGVAYLAQTGASSPSTGFNITLSALAAVFLGSTAIRPGTFNVPGTIVGVFFVGVMVNGLTLAGAAGWVQPVFNGAAVVIAVSASSLLRHKRGG